MLQVCNIWLCAGKFLKLGSDVLQLLVAGVGLRGQLLNLESQVGNCSLTLLVVGLSLSLEFFHSDLELIPLLQQLSQSVNLLSYLVKLLISVSQSLNLGLQFSNPAPELWDSVDLDNHVQLIGVAVIQILSQNFYPILTRSKSPLNLVQSGESISTLLLLVSEKNNLLRERPCLTLNISQILIITLELLIISVKLLVL